jgi:hypothetical protein
MFWGVVLTTSLLLAGTALSAVQTTAPSQGQQRRPSYEFADNGSSLSSPEAYRSGVDDGNYDRANSSPALLRDRGWRDQQEQRAYAAGYRTGYYGVRGLPYDNNAFGNSGPGFSHRDNNDGNEHSLFTQPLGNNHADQIGYGQGRFDGIRDRRTGNSFSPTKDDNYRTADRGYDPSFGGRDHYKHMYRDAYRIGYREGYINCMTMYGTLKCLPLEN